MKNVIGKWRNSATLIALGRQTQEALASDRKKTDYNYDVLVQTRTRSASFPNSVVFPGGATESADSSEKWLKLLKFFGYTVKDFKALYENTKFLTPIFHNNPGISHVALRITAIRETFEELGLLLCSQEHNNAKDKEWASTFTNIDVGYWQDKVNKDPNEFLNLCKEHNCYPDIWSLHYWSNWLTPSRRPSRFDAAFFITALKEKPSFLRSSSEVTRTEWCTPAELLEKSKNKSIELYPPQCYELSFLTHLNDICNLKGFCEKRLDQCNLLLYPISFKARDGLVQVLPGDDLYPADINYNDQIITVDKTILELREQGQILHRFEFTPEKKLFISKNYKPQNVMDGKMVEFYMSRD